MALRADYRRDFAEQFLPRIATAAESEGFTQARCAGKQWVWVRAVSGYARAEILVSEMTGRHVHDGIDILASGSIYLDQVEHRLRERGPRHPDAATLTAPLRAWGLNSASDSRYPLRWKTAPGARVEALIRDLRSFASFAKTIDDVADVSAERLAHSRIRNHVESGLAPIFSTTEVATLITQMTCGISEEKRSATSPRRATTSP